MTPGMISRNSLQMVLTVVARLKSLWAAESGSVSMVHAVAVMFFTVMIVMLINVGHVTHHKVEMQNAADSVAITAATWQARGMNAVTATNHVIGEMLAFVALHEAIGGPRLDNPEELGPADTSEVDARLEAAYRIASSMGARTPAYTTVRQEDGVYADNTILESKIRLKEWLTWIYYMKAAAKAMQYSGIPAVVAAGEALETLMDAFEEVIKLEYEILMDLHKFAASKVILGLKELLRDDMLPTAKKYTDLVVERTPMVAQRAAEQIAESNGTLGTLYPFQPELPLEIDPFSYASSPFISDNKRVPAKKRTPPSPPPRCTKPGMPQRQVDKTCQLTRAAWPWVHYHRKPILDALSPLYWSNARKHYFDWTAGATIYLAHDLQRDWHQLGLYVLKGYPAPDKGYALWTEDGKRADRLFTVLGLSYRGKPLVAGEDVFFAQAHPKGRVAIAQAMIYNGNCQKRADYYIDLLGCARIHPYRQADVGWDTLNWKEGHAPTELLGIDVMPYEFPEIQVNWQAKLVPLSTARLKQLRNASELKREFQPSVKRLLPEVPRSLRTH